MKVSAERHAKEIKEMQTKKIEITREDLDVRGELMILRCQYLIAEELVVGFKEAEDNDQMNFVYDHREYLFTLLQRIVTLDVVDKTLDELRAKRKTK